MQVIPYSKSTTDLLSLKTTHPKYQMYGMAKNIDSSAAFSTRKYLTSTDIAIVVEELLFKEVDILLNIKCMYYVHY